MEYFVPFAGVPVTSAQLIPLSVLQKVSKCFVTYNPPGVVKQVIVCCSSDGQIKIFYQVIDFK